MRLAAVAVFLLALPAPALPAQSQSDGAPDCPETRAHIEPDLNTVPEDGALYERQRRAIQVPVQVLIDAMGGIERAYETAIETRAGAEREIAAGAAGADLRYHLDTILRADALIEILDCRTGRDQT